MLLGMTNKGVVCMKFKGNRRISDTPVFSKRVQNRRRNLSFLEQQQNSKEATKELLKNNKIHFCSR